MHPLASSWLAHMSLPHKEDICSLSHVIFLEIVACTIFHSSKSLTLFTVLMQSVCSSAEAQMQQGSCARREDDSQCQVRLCNNALLEHTLGSIQT